MFEMHSRVVVVNLCGAPATGKSTVACHLREVLQLEADVFYLSYDRIERGKYEKREQKPLWERETWRSKIWRSVRNPRGKGMADV